MLRKKVKVAVDIIMSAALIVLMAYQVTGDKYHEWIGIGELLLFILHNALNIRWYRTILKGKYNLHRIMITVINFMILFAIFLTAISGIILSKHVFSFLPIYTGMSMARKIHLAGSYWSFALIGIHLGMHWSTMTERRGLRVVRILMIVAGVCGAIVFVNKELYKTMFLVNKFVMLDFSKPVWHILLENVLMMISWILVGDYLKKSVIHRWNHTGRIKAVSRKST